MSRLISSARQHYIYIMMMAGALLLVWMTSQGPVMRPDSAGYIANSIRRLPAYPIFLDLFLILPESVSLHAVVLIQGLISLTGVMAFLAAIRRKFNPHPLGMALIFLLLMIPFYQCVRLILTESLSYGMMLILWSVLLNFKVDRIKILAVLSVLILLLALLRPQFKILFLLLPMLSVILVWKRLYRTGLICLACSILIVAGVKAITSVYQAQLVRKTPGISDTWLNMHLMVPRLYLASQEHLDGIDDPESNEALRSTLIRLENEGMTLRTDEQGLFHHYWYRINDIYNEECALRGADLRLRADPKYEKSVAMHLMMKGWKEHLIFLIINLRTKIWPFVVLISLCWCVYLWRILQDRSEWDNLPVFMLLLITMTLANYCVFSLFGRYQPRYLFYTDFPLVAIFTIIIGQSLSKIKIEDQQV